MKKCLLAALLLTAFASFDAFAAKAIVVGSKLFTEGYVLGEIAAQSIESVSKVPVERNLGMGSTGILFEALSHGAIDLYADYTGTLSEAILKQPDLKSLEDIEKALADQNDLLAWWQRGQFIPPLSTLRFFARRNIYTVGVSRAAA